MLFSLWIAASLCHIVASNSIFGGFNVGWRSADIFYKIGDLSKIKATEAHVKDALSWFTENTCLNFIDYRDAPENSKIDLPIEDVEGEDECSYNGIFQIGDCIGAKFYMIHEIGHFLAFYHTYTRPDWRNYIKPLPGFEDLLDESHLGCSDCYSSPVVQFDYGSGMHHRLENMANPVDEAYISTLGQSVRFPFSDYHSMNWLFNCSGKCPTQPKCENGGYTHPRDCNRCMCNKYYMGDFCETPRQLIKLSCEGSKNHTSIHHKQDFNETLWNNRLLQDDFHNARDDLWQIIEGPAGMQIEVDVLSTSGFQPSLRCTDFVAEVNDGDLNLVGRMFCDKTPINNKFVARSNKIGFHAEYPTEWQLRIEATFTLLGCHEVPEVTTTTEAKTTEDPAKATSAPSQEPGTSSTTASSPGVSSSEASESPSQVTSSAPSIDSSSSSTTTMTTDPSTSSSTMTTVTATSEASKDPDTTTTPMTSEAPSTATPNPLMSDKNECGTLKTASSPPEITTTAEIDD